MRAERFFLVACLATAGLAAGTAAQAAPFKPGSDEQVLERLPLRRDSAQRRELAALRERARGQPDNPDAAVALARGLYEAWAADGDPRHIGHAQAALKRWWASAEPPLAVRVMRAVLLQLNHDFDAALKDLHEAVRQDPEESEAWSWIAAVSMVQADYRAAAEACTALAAIDDMALWGQACQAQVDAATGQAERAARSFEGLLRSDGQLGDESRLWLLTRLAETQQRLGRFDAAEQAFKQALALQRSDGYLQAAYADFLLDRDRPAEVLPLLKDGQRSDVLLLRLAIAAKRTRAATAVAMEQALAARFEAARARGDTVHRKEEARFALEVQGDAARALGLAEANYAQQREEADARLLLEAALAARRATAARPVLDWLSRSGLQSVTLQALVQKLRALP